MIMTGAVPITSVGNTTEAALANLNQAGLIKNANNQRFWVKPECGEFKTMADLDGSVLVGTPADVARGVERYLEIGADLLIFDFRFRFADWLEQIETLVNDVLPRVGATAGSVSG